MGRVSLEFPGKPVFTCPFPVRITDINYAGHMGMDIVLGLAHDIRLKYLQSLGYKNELVVGDSIGMVTTDAEIVFKAEIFYEDSLEAVMAFSDFNKYGFDIHYIVRKGPAGIEAIQLKTGIVFFDIQKRQVAPIPECFMKKIT